MNKQHHNILIVIPSLAFGWGAEKVAATLGTLFAADDTKTIRLCTFYDATNKYPTTAPETCFHETLTPNIIVKMYKLLTRSYKIHKLCQAESIDTIISLMEDANFSVILSRLFSKRRVIVSIRHSIASYGFVYKKLIQSLYPHADSIVVLTQAEAQNSILPKHIVHVIPNALDTLRAREKGQENVAAEHENLFTNQTTDKKFRFITVGRLTGIKNQKLLIEAFRIIHTSFPQTELLILGDGPLRSSLQNQSLDLPVHFVWNQENVFAFLTRADCFVLSSVSEAFPNVILEAMACGLPIISTETQGSVEILSPNAGKLTANGDVQALADAMIQMLDTDTHAKYKAAATQRINDYTLDHIFAQWEKLVENTDK